MYCFASNLYDGTTYRFQVQEICLEEYLNSLVVSETQPIAADTGLPNYLATITARTTQINPPEVNMHLPE